MSDTTDGLGMDPDSAPDEPSALASAYLDGEATADERARVEASDELLDEVESLRQVRAVLGATTEPPPISVREAHLAAALDVWDRMSDMERSGDVTPGSGIDAAAAAAISTPRSTSLGARRDRRAAGNASKWLLGTAAGLIVLAGAGIVVRDVMTGSDDESATDAAPADVSDEELSEAEIVAGEARDEFIGADVEAAPIEVDDDAVFDEDERTQGGDAMDETMMADEVADTQAPAEESGEESMEESTDVASDAPAPTESADSGGGVAPGEAEPFPQEIDLDPLGSPTELGEFAAIAYYAQPDPEAPADQITELPFNRCSDEFAAFFTIDSYPGPALYRGRQVIVGVDRDPTPPQVIAYDQESCEIVEQTALPTREQLDASRDQP